MSETLKNTPLFETHEAYEAPKPVAKPGKTPNAPGQLNFFHHLVDFKP